MRRLPSVGKSTQFKKHSKRLSRATSLVLLGAIAVISVSVISLAGSSVSKRVTASTNRTLTQVNQRGYKATRPIVVGKQTGQLRMPTKQEVDEVVANLATLANRQSEGLQQTSLGNGGVAVDLAGGFGGVMLARPGDNGTWETRCVFTIEEGAAFLGLVEDDSAQ